MLTKMPLVPTVIESDAECASVTDSVGSHSDISANSNATMTRPHMEVVCVIDICQNENLAQRKKALEEVKLACIPVGATLSHIQIPSTALEWSEVARQYERNWNFPHCLGSVDGKHIVIQKPMLTGSEFINYKSTFSIVLFALADANYNLLFVDAGCQGRISDGGVFRASLLYKKMEQEKLNLPTPTALGTRQKNIPFFFIGDDAFALGAHMMKPFSGYFPRTSLQRIFNYRICRARRIVENVFGIMSAVFRILRKPLLLEPENAQLIVLTVSHLHNFLRRNKTSQSFYTPPGTFDEETESGNLINGNWRTMIDENASSFLPLQNIPRRPSQKAQEIRMELAEFFVSEEGRVEWQNEYS